MLREYRIDMKKLRMDICGNDKIPHNFERLGLYNLHEREYDRETREFEYKSIGEFEVHVLPSKPKYNRYGELRKSSEHRVFVRCKCCSKMIPAGRLMQHMDRKDHK